MAIRVPIRIRGDRSSAGLEAERVFEILDWYLLQNKNINTFKLVAARALESTDISFIDWLVLKHILASDGTMTISGLAEKFDLNVPQATILVKSLVKKNLVKQKISSTDRRVKYLKCSRRGTKLVFDCEESIQHSMRYWLFDLSDNEIAKFTQITEKISGFELPPRSIV